MSRGHCILSHGFESGPDATKVTALAEVAERLGFTSERPDYTDLDARLEVSRVGDVPARLQRLVPCRNGRCAMQRARRKVGAIRGEAAVQAVAGFGMRLRERVLGQQLFAGIVGDSEKIAVSSVAHCDLRS